MKRTTRILLFAALSVLGAAFVLIGAFSGQALAVLNKAIRVCLECIGIG
jgi:hypothetical protein